MSTLLLVLPFMIAQGGAIFVTAWFLLKKLNWTAWYSKLIFMALSYFAWSALTVALYISLGGSGGLMEGGGMMLMALFSALIAVSVYTAGWLAFSFMKSKTHG